jgi:hypothetical protein
MLDSIADQFSDDFCGKPDPRPDLVQEARAKTPRDTLVADARSSRDSKRKAESEKRDEIADKITGAELARRAVDDARNEGNANRSGLGAASIARKDAVAQPTTILNAPKSEPEPAPPQTVAAAAPLPGAAKPMPPPSRPTPTKCNVFTASYGGQKAVIIKAMSTEGVNYTVLDVNEGAEKSETDAFIQAYAKGGQLVGEFQSSNHALDKAFELCPEN